MCSNTLMRCESLSRGAGPPQMVLRGAAARPRGTLLSQAKAPKWQRIPARFVHLVGEFGRLWAMYSLFYGFRLLRRERRGGGGGQGGGRRERRGGGGGGGRGRRPPT